MKAWYAKVSPDRRRLFVGRHYDGVAIDQDRVVVTSRRGTVVLTAPTHGLRVERVRGGLLLQVLARDADDNTHVFEFRPRHHAEGRALARSFAHAPADTSSADASSAEPTAEPTAEPPR
jgi:hypothetical protein